MLRNASSIFSISLVFRIRSLSLQAGYLILGFPGGSVVNNLPASAGDMNLIPGLGRSPGEGNGNSLQYSCLENPMDRGACWATGCGVMRVGHYWATKQHQRQQHISSLPQPPCPPKPTKSQHDPEDALVQRFQKCHVTLASERAAAELMTLSNKLCPTLLPAWSRESGSAVMKCPVQEINLWVHLLWEDESGQSLRSLLILTF